MNAICRVLLAYAIALGLTTIAVPALAQPDFQPAEVRDGTRSLLLPPQRPAREATPASPQETVHLGVTLDPQIRNYAVVRLVEPGGAADEAGLQPGDTIEAMNGVELRSPYDLVQRIGAMRPGDIVDIDFSRRITGRTQAVLEGSRRDAPRTGENSRRARPEPVDQATYEELPPSDRTPQSDLRRGDGPRTGDAGDDPEARSSERERRGSFRRDRPLLRWRRN